MSGVARVLLVILLVTLPGSAWAQPRDKPSDPKLATGLTLSGVGAALMIGGGAAYAQSDDEGDCLDCGENRQLRAASLGLLVGGAGITSIGVLVAIAGGVDKGYYPRRDNALMSSGIVLTTVGAGGVLASTALWLYAAFVDEVDVYVPPPPNGSQTSNTVTRDTGAFITEKGWGVGAGMFAVSATLLAAGAPMWAGGAKPPRGDHDPQALRAAAATPESKHVPRSPAMMAAGTAMCVAGAGVIAGAAIADAELDGARSSSRRDTDTAIMWAGSALGAGVLLGVGLPFAIHGSSKVAPVDAYAMKPPEIRVGPTGGSLKWEF